MQSDPAGDWQRLTRLYGEMSDEELLNLAASFGDLTEFAQPILRDEMRKRGLGDPLAPQQTASTARQSDQRKPDKDEDGSEDHFEYTWKTVLCECDTPEQVTQIREVLRRAGIESWTSGPSSYFGSQTTRILIAADQFEEASQVIAQPVPQDVIDQSKVKVEDFIPPACPKCGAEDPLLESVDPMNTWRCENCGAQWSDSAAFDTASPAGN